MRPSEPAAIDILQQGEYTPLSLCGRLFRGGEWRYEISVILDVAEDGSVQARRVFSYNEPTGAAVEFRGGPPPEATDEEVYAFQERIALAARDFELRALEAFADAVNPGLGT